MSSHWISIYALIGMFVLATVLPINMGVIAFVGAFLVGTLVAGMNAKAIMGGFPGRPVPDAGRHHLPVRAGAEQRHDRLARQAGGARRARAHRRHPVDHVLHRRAAHGGGRGQPGRGGDHRADRAGLCRQVRHQPAADGPDGGARRAGRRLLADQHLRRHHQQDRRQGRPAAQRDRDHAGQPRRQPGRGAAAVLPDGRHEAAAPEGRRQRRAAAPCGASRTARAAPRCMATPKANRSAEERRTAAPRQRFADGARPQTPPTTARASTRSPPWSACWRWPC